MIKMKVKIMLVCFLFLYYSQVDDQIHFEDAIKDEKWTLAMDWKTDAIEKSNTWDIVNLQEGKYMIGVKWVYKIKINV